MPQFLTTSGTSYLIESLIIRAKTELVFITPYLKLSRILFERLTEASNRGVNIKLVYGKSELHPNERKQLDYLRNIELLFLENLHAKCYHNETTLIISSMNLYEFSEKNNREMGIVLTRRDDGDCFADALAEAHSIINAAQGSAHPIPYPPTSVVGFTSLTKTPSEPQSKRQINQVQMVQKVFDLLNQLPNADGKLNLETKPDSWKGEHFFSTITAKDYPRRGLEFSFSSAFRFGFTKSEDYQAVKSTQRGEIERLLGSDYRCFWNKDAISFYAAQDYRQIDEDTTAEYFVKAIKSVTDVLRAFPC